MSRTVGVVSAWTLAWKNLKRNRRRNLATGCAIALGFAALLALGGYITRVENYLRVYTIYGTRTGHLVIYKKNGYEKYSIKPRDYSLNCLPPSSRCKWGSRSYMWSRRRSGRRFPWLMEP